MPVPEDIQLSDFTEDTYKYLTEIVEARYGHPCGTYMHPTAIPFESATALFFILRATPDEYFPGGKWSTIQHLESLIEGR